MTAEQAKEEIKKMSSVYYNYYKRLNSHSNHNVRVAFLMGSSLCGNLQGDSVRYQELKKLIKNINN